VKPFNQDTDLNSNQGNDSELEFILQVDDLQSVISYNGGDQMEMTYEMKQSNLGKRIPSERPTLSDMYSTVESECKRAKLREDGTIYDVEDNKMEQKCSTNMIYDMKTLFGSLKGKGKIEVEAFFEQIQGTKPKLRKREIKSIFKEKNMDLFFQSLSKKLRNLAKDHNKNMDEIHMLFMEVSCDFDDLQRLLEGQMENHKWSMLEDLAIQTDPNSMEFEHVVKQKGLSQVRKRKRFLELMESQNK